MRLGIYCRISKSKEEGKDRSIDNQRMLGIVKANELGMDYKLYLDEGKSAFSDKIEDRPEFENLLLDISEGLITAVFAFDQSRFERNPHVRFITNGIFKKFNVKYYTHLDGLVDLYDPQAEFFGDIVSIINRYQVTMTKLKVKSVLKQRASEGKAHGIDAFGYCKDSNGFIIINPEEADLVKRIFKLSLEGVGTQSIANMFNAENIKTRYNKIKSGGVLRVKNKFTNEIKTIDKKDIKWSGNTIRNIITNTIYKGQRKYTGLTFEVPMLIEPEYFDRVNSNLNNNRNNSGKKVVHQYLLRGLLRCGECGRNYYGKARVDKRDFFYMCSSKRIKESTCSNRSINISKIEDFIWYNLFSVNGFKERLKLEFTGDRKNIINLDNEIKQIYKNLEGLATEKEKAIDLALKGIVSEQDLLKSIKKIENKLKENNISLIEKQKTYNNIKESEAIIEKYTNNFVDFTKISSFTQKQTVIKDFIKNIVVTCYQDLYYIIRIQYKIDIEDEEWQSRNLLEPVFFKLIKKPDGTHEAFVSTPPPMSDPSSNKNWNNWVDSMEKAEEDQLTKYEKMEEEEN